RDARSFYLFFMSYSDPLRLLHSFPTRRSSDLIAVGVGTRSLLPKVGPWMEGVKKAFGVMLLAVALWLVSPVIPAAASMLGWALLDRKSTRLNSSHVKISYAVFCLKKKKKKQQN